MRAFLCQRCRQPVGFEAMDCGHCGSKLGFDPETSSLRTLRAQGAALGPWVDQPGEEGLQWLACQRRKAASTGDGKYFLTLFIIGAE